MYNQTSDQQNPNAAYLDEVMNAFDDEFVSRNGYSMNQLKLGFLNNLFLEILFGLI